MSDWDEWIRERQRLVTKVASKTGSRINPSWVNEILGELRVHNAKQEATILELRESLRRKISE